MEKREAAKAVNNAMEYAEGICTDWKPIHQWECKEIEMIWFKPDQLKELIRYCIELGENRSNQK